MSPIRTRRRNSWETSTLQIGRDLGELGEGETSGKKASQAVRDGRSRERGEHSRESNQATGECGQRANFEAFPTSSAPSVITAMSLYRKPVTMQTI